MRPNKGYLLTLILGIILLVLFIGGLTWINLRFSAENPGGTDFLVHWEGARAFMFEGISPYSDEVAFRIQKHIYGRLARKGEHEFRVAYPFYSELLFAPFALIRNYILARAIWMTVLETGLVSLTLISLKLANWHPRGVLLLFLFLFSLLWYHGMRPLINGNAVILVALLLTTSMWMIVKGHDEAAGVLIAFSTIKPHVVLLFLVFVFVWAISRKRWKILYWAVGMELLLIFGGLIFLPGWIQQNIWEILRYRQYNPPGTVFDVFKIWFPGIGAQISIFWSGLLVLLLIYEWIKAWRKDYHWFLWTTSITLVISQWIGIQTDPGNFIILFFPLILVLSVVCERWPRIGKWVVSAILLFLLVGLWVLFLKTVTMGNQPQQSPVMFFPLPLFLMIGLYWIRWWVTKQARFQENFLD